MKIRLFHEQDAAQIAQLFHETVRAINIHDYSTNQVKAWAPDNMMNISLLELRHRLSFSNRSSLK